MKKSTIAVPTVWLLAPVLYLLGVGCFSEGGTGSAANCSPRDFTTDCCLKKNPGHYEQCLGMSDVYRFARPTAAAISVAATLPHDGKGSPQSEPDNELEPHLRDRVEEALVRCARQADREINEEYLGGKTPDARRCSELAPNGQEWSAWLGVLKHAAARRCLERELPRLIPGRYHLEIRFLYTSSSATWESLTDKRFHQYLNQFGWQLLNNIIAPDVVILDPTGTRVVAVYDFKFPCPETNEPKWSTYTGKHYWSGTTQGRAWHTAFDVKPLRVTPREGVVRRKIMGDE